MQSCHSVDFGGADIISSSSSSSSSINAKDPVKVIREALAKGLVFYYPFAGRLIEGPNRKLMVDCTAEGVLLTEADADVQLDRLGGDVIRPGCPYLDELLHDVRGSEGIIVCLPLLIQGQKMHLPCDLCGKVTFLLQDNLVCTSFRGYSTSL